MARDDGLMGLMDKYALTGAVAVILLGMVISILVS